MIGGVDFASSQLASIYNSNSEQLSSTLSKIASGKKFQNASEDLIGFIRSSKIGLEIDGYDQVKQGLTEFKTYTSAAVQAGSSLYDDLSKMQSLAEKYGGTADTDLQAEYSAEFETLRSQVNSTLTNTSVDGVTVTTSGSSLATADLNPEGTGALDLNFTANATVVNVTAFDITDAANIDDDIQAELDNTLTFMSEAKALDNIASQQIKLTDTIINSKQAVKSLITDIDEAKEMNNAIDQSVRQQAAISMMAQANMSRQSIVKLYM
jgi:flagellin